MNKEGIIGIYLTSLEIERAVGIPALFSTAQAILECGWNLHPIIGKGNVDSNNIYGIKWHNYYKEDKNDYVEAITKEFVNGKYITITAKFQKYNSLGDCIRDHSRLLLDSSLGYFQCLSILEKIKI